MKILVISLAGIGDTLIATPLAKELRLNFPEARIDFLVFWPGASDLLLHNPNVNRVTQKNLVREGRLRSLRFLMSLRRERYDVSLNTHPQSKRHYRIVAFLVGARVRASHAYDNSTRIDRLLVNRFIPQDYSIHSIENNLRLLPLIGAREQLSSHEFELFLTSEERAWAGGFAMEHGLATAEWMGLHVGSGTTKNLRFKRWPLAHYRELIDRLLKSHPARRIILFGGPDEEADNVELLASANSSRLIPARTPSVRHAAALLEKCPVFLSVDNLMMHLAAAMKVPRQIVIESPTYGPTLAPYGRPFTLVPNPMTHGRNLDFYRYDGGDIRGTPETLKQCMESVTVQAVFDAVSLALCDTFRAKGAP